MLDIFVGRRPPSSGYRRFAISNEVLECVRDAANPAHGSAAFDLEVREKISLLSFQAPDKIADGVRLFSNVELWKEVAGQLGATPERNKTDAKTLKRDLSIVVRRRNKIAHEGDIQPATPREPWPIYQRDIVYVSDLIERIVRSVDVVVQEE